MLTAALVLAGIIGLSYLVSTKEQRAIEAERIKPVARRFFILAMSLLAIILLSELAARGGYWPR